MKGLSPHPPGIGNQRRVGWIAIGKIKIQTDRDYTDSGKHPVFLVWKQ